MSKIFSGISLVFLCLTVSVTWVFSMSYNASQIDAANFLAERWIIVDQSSNPSEYNLDSFIERKATMKVVMKLSGVDIPDVCYWVFSDVQSGWHCKYIEQALAQWFISLNTTFRPDDNITKTEAMKLVLQAKGIEKIANTAIWQEDYMETAYHYGIIQEKYYDYNALASRGWIFEIATASIKRQEAQESIKEELMSDEAL